MWRSIHPNAHCRPGSLVPDPAIFTGVLTSEYWAQALTQGPPPPKADPFRGAPLVRRLVETTDPSTGHPLTDEAIRDELICLFWLPAMTPRRPRSPTRAAPGFSHHEVL